MSLEAKLGIISAILAIIGAFLALLQWLIKHYLSELKPNSGSSMNDRITRVESRVDDIYRLLISRHAE
jgi:hypothetical protein